jgi:hypothetical protein
MSNHRRLLDALLLAFRPARWAIFGFRFVPLVLLAAGVWAMVYGGFYHRIAVTETHEELVSVAVPVEPTMPSGMVPFSVTDAFGQPTDEPSPPPDALSVPVKFVESVKTTKTTSEEREIAVNQAVTVAGIVRDPQGEIVRLSDAAQGPAFCPT